ncbi:hypothetical protein HN011_001060 [Eciton burchellii]|nr:hypothetical protein HN011_001060 [Eciton burchellii]
MLANATERRRCADLRDRFAARRHATEKYYDCLQCTEQCCHVDNSNPGGSGGNSNNNNYYYSYGNSNCHGSKNNAVAVVNRGNHRSPLSHMTLYRGKEAASPTQSPPSDGIRRIRSLVKNNPVKSMTRHQSAHLTPAKRRSSLARPVRIHDSFVQPRRLMAEEEEEEEEEDEEDDEIEEEDHRQDSRQSHQQAASCKNPWWWQDHRDRQQPNASNYTYHRDEDGNQAEEEEEEDEIEEEDHRQDSRQSHQQAASCKNPWWWQDHRDRQQPNASNYTYHRDEDGSAGWPIRLRLEQMLEFTLPQTKRKKKKKKKKKPTTTAAATTTTTTATMMLMKQQQRSRHNFKDTERLLKVLSINNVDQDNRYNIKRCSVM